MLNKLITGLFYMTRRRGMLEAGISVRTIIGALVTVPLLCVCAYASSAGGSSADFLNMSASPDAIALGDSILALDYSPSSIITNPAMLADSYQPKLSFTNTVFGNDIKYSFAGISVPIRFGSLAAAANYVDYGDVPAYDANFIPYFVPKSEETVIVLNYSIPIRKDVPVLKEYGSAGMNVKFINSSLAGYTSYATAFDIGGTYNMPFVLEGLKAGLVFRNNGEAHKYNRNSSSLPASINVALRYDTPFAKDLFAVVDASKDPDNTYYSLGVGVSPVYPLSLRCAWKQADKYAASGFRFGLGITLRDLTLRYSMSPMKDISTVNTIALDIAFESFTKPQSAHDYYLKRYYELGRDKYNARDYIEARQIFEDVLSVYPGHLPSKEYLLKINAKLDELEQRQQVQTDRWLRKADIALERNDIIEAKKYYSLVLNIDSENAYAMEGLNRISEILGEGEQAEQEQLNRVRITKLWENALDFYKKGDYIRAREKFQEMLGIDPTNEEAARYINEIYDQLNRITGIQSEELFNRGIEYYRQGNYLEARKYFNLAIISNPERKDIQEYIDSCGQKLEEEKNKAAAEEAASKDGKVQYEIETQYFGALKMFQKGQYDNAVQSFAKCRELAEQSGYKKYAESSRYYVNASNNALAEQYYKQGYSFYKLKKYEAAVDSYKKSLDYNIEYSASKVELDRLSAILAQSYYEMGMKAYSLGGTEKARELFKKSLEYQIDKTESIQALERLQ